MQFQLESLRLSSVMQILAHEILQWANNVLACELPAPVHVIIHEHTRTQSTIWLNLTFNSGGRLEEDQLAGHEGAAFVFDIPLIASNALVG